FCVVLVFCLVAQKSNWKYGARWMGMLIAAALVMSLAWAGHGAAADDLPLDFLHLPADLLHLLATSAWLGALVPLGMLLRTHTPAARIATLRFSTLGITCVGILIVTGVVNTWFLSGSIPALVGTLYGQLLLLKIALFALMIAIANVNRKRLVPALQQGAATGRLYGNTLAEASLGLLVLGIVGIIGTLPPGLHTEPRWPFPYRLDLSEIAAGAQKLLDVAATLFVLCLAAGALAADRRRYGGVTLSIGGLLVCGSIAAIAMRPGIVRAYPTSYFASPQAYAAPSVALGAPLYAANCTPCHGTDGRGDGPIAKSLSIPPANLTEEHIFAHSVGDIFWWISYGKGNGVMPGFASTLTPTQRWDLINYVLARAAGTQTSGIGSQVAASASAPLPDFAFEQGGAQNTLRQTLKTGPVLLVLFAHPVPQARLGELTSLEPRLAGVGLRVIAVSLSAFPANPSPPVVGVSRDVRSTLALFRSANDGGETEIMLDRNATVRARWIAKQDPDAGTLLADADRVARIPVAAANHAGHGG
ncbi:MAG: CopD family protein, partial [Vulcanimicrobiaceae bacterium]